MDENIETIDLVEEHHKENIFFKILPFFLVISVIVIVGLLVNSLFETERIVCIKETRNTNYKMNKKVNLDCNVSNVEVQTIENFDSSNKNILRDRSRFLVDKDYQRVTSREYEKTKTYNEKCDEVIKDYLKNGYECQYISKTPDTILEQNKVTFKLLGNEVEEMNINEKYKDKGFEATIDGENANEKVEIDTRDLKKNKMGEYVIKYNFKVSDKHTEQYYRIIKVIDSEIPRINLKGPETLNLKVGAEYKEPGYTATDNLDGNITHRVTTFGDVDYNTYGKYEIKYSVFDNSGHTSTKIRTIIVSDYTAPSLTLTGPAKIELKKDEKYVEPGYEAYDDQDGDISDKVKVTNKPKSGVVGVYTVKYTTTDSSGNKTTKTRKVYVGTTEELERKTYIVVSISKQKLWFYKRGEIHLTSNIVTGDVGKHDTPKGTFRIFRKSRNIYLTGPGYRSFVNYWMQFTKGGVGLHDAGWRSRFGGAIYRGNGSHGCVNMPKGMAKTLYSQIHNGTKVIVK